MPLYDQSENLDVQQSLGPATRTASENGAAVPFGDYEAATIVFSAGTITDGTHLPSVEVSDDNGGSWSPLANGDLVGSLANLASDAVQMVGYIAAGKTDIRAVTTVSGATGGGDYEAFVIRGIKGSQ